LVQEPNSVRPDHGLNSSAEDENYLASIDSDDEDDPDSPDYRGIFVDFPGDDARLN
jgi:hypothetical protein